MPPWTWFLRPDDEIRSEIVSQVLVGEFATNLALVHIEVTDGVARMTGNLERKSMLPLVLPLVRAIDGVIDAGGLQRGPVQPLVARGHLDPLATNMPFSHRVNG